MVAAACLANEPVTIDGSKRMRERPVAEGVELLRSLGASIDYVEDEGRLPVRVAPSERLVGGTVEVGRTASSQFISAIMLIAPWLRDGVRIVHHEPPTSASYLALTVDALRASGGRVRVERDASGTNRAIAVSPGMSSQQEVDIEPDASSAVYWWGAAALSPGTIVRVPGLGFDSAQPDVRMLDALAAAGAHVEHNGTGATVTGPERLAAIDWDASQFPDGSMALAAVLSRAHGRSRITGLHTLRVKETDRLAALAVELERLGCRTHIEGDDALVIDPGNSLGRTDPVTIATYNDHRMAMAFAMLGLIRGSVRIADPRCVEKSYPTFWRDLAHLIAGP
jgi:3-phosphoshikimate 1-carboxyvinyltransferase